MARETQTAATSREGLRAYAVAAALLVGGAVATEAASRFLVSRFPDRPMAPDLLFEILPHTAWARSATSLALVSGFAVFAVYAFGRRRDEIPEFAAMLGIMYLLRAALLVLTPLANAHGGEPAAFPLFQYGMFPSGHTGAIVLLALFIDRRDAPGFRKALLALALAVSAGLILARSHYTIDIAGGALLAYFIQREWTAGTVFGPVKRLMGLAYRAYVG